jgi:hypothetical protein
MGVTKTNIIGIVDLSETKTGNLAASSEESVAIQPPVGQTYQVIQCGFYTGVPAGGSSGTHYVLFHSNSIASSQRFQFFKHISAHDGALDIMGSGQVKTATQSETPSDEIQQLMSIFHRYATYSEPLYLGYKNLTDVAQDKDRLYEIKCLVYSGGF